MSTGYHCRNRMPFVNYAMANIDCPCCQYEGGEITCDIPKSIEKVSSPCANSLFAHGKDNTGNFLKVVIACCDGP